MSHFVKIKTSIREREHLIQALRDLGYTVEEGQNLTIQGDSGKTELAAIVVRTGSGYDVGFPWSGSLVREQAVVARRERGEVGIGRGIFRSRLSRKPAAGKGTRGRPSARRR